MKSSLFFMLLTIFSLNYAMDTQRDKKYAETWGFCNNNFSNIADTDKNKLTAEDKIVIAIGEEYRKHVEKRKAKLGFFAQLGGQDN